MLANFACSAPGELNLSFETCYRGFGHGLATVETLMVEQALAICAGWLQEGTPNAVAAEACKDGVLQGFVQQHSRLLNLGMVPTNTSTGLWCPKAGLFRSSGFRKCSFILGEARDFYE